MFSFYFLAPLILPFAVYSFPFSLSFHFLFLSIGGIPLKVLADSEMGCPEYIRSCMEDCWAEFPEQRPDFPTIRDRLRKMREGMWVHFYTVPFYLFLSIEILSSCVTTSFYHLHSSASTLNDSISCLSFCRYTGSRLLWTSWWKWWWSMPTISKS